MELGPRWFDPTIQPIKLENNGRHHLSIKAANHSVQKVIRLSTKTSLQFAEHADIRLWIRFVDYRRNQRQPTSSDS